MKSYKKIVSILKDESDRGAVLIAASMLDVALENLLKKKLVDSEKRSDPIFENNGSLGTFSSKIEMSYRLGLISKQQKLMFNTFRQLRNEFAHSSIPLTLSDNAIRDRLQAAFDHNPILRDLYVDAVQASTYEDHGISQEETDNKLKSGRFLLDMVFTLEICKLENSLEQVDTIAPLID